MLQFESGSTAAFALYRLTGISGGVLEFENDQTIEIAQVRKAQVEVELKRLEALKDEDFGDEAQFASGLEDDEA